MSTDAQHAAVPPRPSIPPNPLTSPDPLIPPAPPRPAVPPRPARPPVTGAPGSSGPDGASGAPGRADASAPSASSSSAREEPPVPGGRVANGRAGTGRSAAEHAAARRTPGSAPGAVAEGDRDPDDEWRAFERRRPGRTSGTPDGRAVLSAANGAAPSGSSETGGKGSGVPSGPFPRFTGPARPPGSPIGAPAPFSGSVPAPSSGSAAGPSSGSVPAPSRGPAAASPSVPAGGAVGAGEPSGRGVNAPAEDGGTPRTRPVPPAGAGGSSAAGGATRPGAAPAGRDAPRRPSSPGAWDGARTPDPDGPEKPAGAPGPGNSPSSSGGSAGPPSSGPTRAGVESAAASGSGTGQRFPRLRVPPFAHRDAQSPPAPKASERHPDGPSDDRRPASSAPRPDGERSDRDPASRPRAFPFRIEARRTPAGDKRPDGADRGDAPRGDGLGGDGTAPRTGAASAQPGATRPAVPPRPAPAPAHPAPTPVSGPSPSAPSRPASVPWAAAPSRSASDPSAPVPPPARPPVPSSAGEAAGGERAGGERPRAERAVSQRAVAERPVSDRPVSDRGAGERAGAVGEPAAEERTEKAAPGERTGTRPDPAYSWTSAPPAHPGALPGGGRGRDAGGPRQAAPGPAVRPVVTFGEPEAFPVFPAPARPGVFGGRGRARAVAAAVCLVLGLGLIGGAATGSWLIGDSTAAGGGDTFAAARELWHEVPVDQLFPPTLRGDGLGPGGADRTWTRIAVAPDSGCADAFDPLLRRALSPAGCARLLRATYTDATESYVTTVGLLFTTADAATMTALKDRFRQEGYDRRDDLMPRPLAAEGTVAARFGPEQRASWHLAIQTDVPVVVWAVSGWADGRAVPRPQPAAEATVAKAGTDVAQAGLGHEAQGLVTRVENALRTTVTTATEQSS